MFPKKDIEHEVIRAKSNTLGHGNLVISVSFDNFNFRIPSVHSTFPEECG